MKRSAIIIGVGQATLVVGLGLGIAGRRFSLGVPGEWEWLRLPAAVEPNVLSLALAIACLGGFALFAAQGARSIARRPGSVGREVAWVAALAGAAVLVQALIQEGAPSGYGLAKWIVALRDEGSSGYQTVARTQMPTGLGPFLRAYPAWVEKQDSLHIGTHPPGLFVLTRLINVLAQDHPGLARWVVVHAPGSVEPAILAYRDLASSQLDELAALIINGALTLVASALTVVPLYLLARSSGPPERAWAAAVLWPLMPATILFQPTADTAFPFLSVTALAAAAWTVRTLGGAARSLCAASAGLALAVGMQFTLAFLAVGLVVAVVLLASPGPGSWSWRARLELIAATGLGFALATAGWWAATSANPLVIWWTNQAHHAQFYQTYPRSRAAWAGVNLAESIVAVGVASVVWAILGLAHWRTVPPVTWATVLVLVILTVTGRSLSEVARLWLPMYPAILLGAAVAWERWGRLPSSLGWTVALVGAQTLWLECSIQVVYPI